MVELEFRDKTKTLIDSLKSICANYGLGMLPAFSVTDSFTKMVADIFSRQEKLELENQQLIELRDWLLPLLMNGKVTVK